MNYGAFDDKSQEYVILNPDTPKPWINYLGTKDYCALISNNAGGYSFFKSPRSGKILRYRFNSIPQERPGRYIYIKDMEDGDYWTASWQPVGKDLKHYQTRTRHGLGYTIIESSYKKIEAKTTYYVPLNFDGEIWQLEIKNCDKKKKVFNIFSYAEFSFWYSFQDLTNFQYILYTARMNYFNNLIDYKLRYSDGEDKYAFFTSTQKVLDFDTDREIFIGTNRSESNPLAVEKGKCSRSLYEGGNPCAALRHEVILMPGEAKTITFILGVGSAKNIGNKVRNKYKTTNLVRKEMDQLSSYWNKLLSNFQCQTPDEDVNRFFNIWNQYQCHVTFKWSRSASFIEAGGRDGLGYRDSLQDVLGVAHSIPEKVKDRLIDLLKGQTSEGCAFHQIQPLTMKTGEGLKPQKSEIFSDDHLWLILAVSEYVRETGDIDFFNMMIPFVDREEGTVFEHLGKTIDFSFQNLGRHELCLGLAADWNDCLNLKNKGESIWTSFLLFKCLNEFLIIGKFLNRKKELKVYQSKFNSLKRALDKFSYNGKWFNRAYLSNGSVIGNYKNKKGKIFLNPQSWAIISGYADKEKAKSSLSYTRKYLETDYGATLLYPAYTDYDPKIGSITTFPRGLKENGGIFCHTNPWLVIAECMLGEGEQAFKHFMNILPAKFNEKIELFTEAPYVYAQFITGKENKRFGRAENPWLTGTAAWCFEAISKYILGVRPDYEGIYLEPCLPEKWDKLKIYRKIRDAEYYIKIKKIRNPKNKTMEIKLNNQPVKNPIPYQPRHTKNYIDIIL